jgi:cobalt-zinc-cadmium efflux system membrane fusion protein
MADCRILLGGLLQKEQISGVRIMTRQSLPMSRRWNLAGGALLAIAAAGACLALLAAGGCNGHQAGEHKGTANSGHPTDERVTLELSQRSVQLSGLKTESATKPTQSRSLELRGSLALDVNRLVHVHARFPGQIIRLSTIAEDPQASSPAGLARRQLNFMDRVTKGQKLAVIWSKDLGEKKSELVDALVHLRIDQLNLKYREELLRKGAGTETAVREGQRNVQVREIAVAKAERTLKSWSLIDEEIRAVKAEAERIETGGAWDMDQDENWASVEVVSPIDGTIVEKNVVEGDLVNADSDLFKVADLSILSAWARIYEEDLPLLRSLPRPITWKLRLNAVPTSSPIVGTIDRIGEIIDPNEHMALLAGLVKNPTGELRAGQFITAIIDLPPEEHVVEVPTRALVEDGDESYVLVQHPDNTNRFTLRRVVVVRRHHDRVYVRSLLTDEQKKEGLEELHEGERVVSAGALELKAAAEEQNSK